MEVLIEKTAAAMRKNGFEVICVGTGAEAKEELLGLIEAGRSVGVGGSASVQEIGILPMLEQKGCTVYSHWGKSGAESKAIQRSAREADVYLCSANAVTRSGKLVLVDGNGNRLGAVCDGPQHLIFVVSHSKVVDGGFDSAMARIKQIATPLNCRRLGLQTACALTGKCAGDACGQSSICNVTLVVDRPPRGRKVTVVFVEEKLGY